MKQSRGLLVVSYLQSPAGHTQENHPVNLAKQRPGLGSVMALSFQGSLPFLSIGGGLRSINDAGEKKTLSQLFTDPLGELLQIYMLNVWMGRVSDFICSSKGLRALKLLTSTAICVVLLCTVGGAVPCFLRLLSSFLLNVVTCQLHDP